MVYGPLQFLGDCYFYLLFDDSSPSLVENIIKRNHEPILTIEGNQVPILTMGFQFVSSSTVLGYVDNVLAMDGPIYVDPLDQVGHL